MADYIITEIRWINCKVGLNFLTTELKYSYVFVVFKIVKARSVKNFRIKRITDFKDLMYSFLKSKAKSWLEKSELMQKG